MPRKADTDRVERVYERYAESRRKRRKWDSANAGNAKIRAELLARMRSEIGERLSSAPILDVGCGTGWLLKELVGLGAKPAQLSAIELLEARVEAARAIAPGVDIRQGDARELPFEDESFGVLTMVCLLSSLGGEDAIHQALGEALRVLSPGGLLLCYEPRVPNPLNRDTRLVSDRILRRALGSGYTTTKLTVLPPLARLLEPRLAGSYERVGRIGPLLTHRLIAYVR